MFVIRIKKPIVVVTFREEDYRISIQPNEAAKALC